VPAAANTVTPEAERAKPGSPSKRANPVALEVLVGVTGARANNGGARELFNEETQTVLVFPDGAVIRLTAPVALGQLLFLTNKRNNTEVVCQVLNARALGPAGAYVELQFTEAKTDFWGVSFSAQGNSAPEFTRKEQVEAQETTQASAAVVVQRHKAEDVDRLKQEVDALRNKLLELERKRNEEAAGRSATEKKKDESAPLIATMANLLQKFVAPSGAAHAPETGNDAAQGATPTSRISQHEMPPEHERASETPLMPVATLTKEPARAVVGMSLPMGKPLEAPLEARGKQGEPAASGAKDLSEDLLPRPELDFSQMPVEMVNGVRSAYRARRAEFRKVTAPAFVVLTVVLGIALWTMKPWRYLGGLKTAISASIAAKPGKPSASPNKPLEAPLEARGKPSKPASAGVAATTGSANDKAKSTGETTDAKATAGTAAPEVSTAKGSENAEPEKRIAEEPKKSGRGRGKNSKAEESGVARNGNAGVIALNDAPVLPAKLVKAANPVYPPDAMRSFITGDVRAELVVESDGRIGEIKVLSGPKPLREAAVEALRQYQYAPATQGGKGVTSKVMTTVKFWFNP
jgi:TonB family protein